MIALPTQSPLQVRLELGLGLEPGQVLGLGLEPGRVRELALERVRELAPVPELAPELVRHSQPPN